MYRTVVTLTRPDLDTPFHDVFVEEELAHIQTAYLDTGKIVSIVKTESEDKLVLTTVRTYINEEAQAEWMTDPVLVVRRVERREAQVSCYIMRDMYAETV